MKLYRGEIIDNNDPEHYFRVKLKIFGVTDDNITPEQAVWAEVMSSTTFGLNKKVGISSVLQVGTMVWCVLDDNDPSKPVVVGVLTGKDDFSDSLGGEKYINAQSWYTKSGHKIIIDDSDGDQFIRIEHKTGSYIFIDNDGNIFVNGVKNAQYDIAENTTWNIGKNLTISVQGDTNVNIQGQRSTSVGADDTLDIGGNWSITNANTTVDTPQASFTGNVSIAGNTSIGGNLSGGGGRARGGGNADFTGTVTASNDVIGGGISLKGHVHKEQGDGKPTSKPM